MPDDIFNTRVLKAHIDAAEESLELVRAILAMGGSRREAATVIAENVVTAMDSKTRYAVLVNDKGAAWLYGPYASFNAALNAAKTGWLNTRKDETLPGFVLPLISAPRKNKQKLVIPRKDEINE